MPVARVTHNGKVLMQNVQPKDEPISSVHILRYRQQFWRIWQMVSPDNHFWVHVFQLELLMLLAVEGSQTGAAYSGWGLTSIVYSSRRVSVPVLLCLFTLQKCLSILQKCLQTCSVRTHSCFQPGGMTSQNDQNPMPFHPNTCYWAILFYSVSRLEQQSSPKVQSRNTWPFCDYWADHTPSRFFFAFVLVNLLWVFGRPPLCVIYIHWVGWHARC